MEKRRYEGQEGRRGEKRGEIWDGRYVRWELENIVMAKKEEKAV